MTSKLGDVFVGNKILGLTGLEFEIVNDVFGLRLEASSGSQIQTLLRKFSIFLSLSQTYFNVKRIWHWRSFQGLIKAYQQIFYGCFQPFFSTRFRDFLGMRLAGAIKILILVVLVEAFPYFCFQIWILHFYFQILVVRRLAWLLGIFDLCIFVLLVCLID